MTIDRRRVSAQWFSGTILTGLCGAALMGGAVFTSLDGETHFATMPERVESALRGAIARAIAGPRKADRLPPAGETNSARQVIRVSMTSRAGNREVMRVRPFVRVSAQSGDGGHRIVRQHPALQCRRRCWPMPTPPCPRRRRRAAEPDAEVSFVHRDLAAVLPRAKIAGVVADRRNLCHACASRQLECARHQRHAIRCRPAPARHDAGLRLRRHSRRSLCRLRSRASCRRTSRSCPRPAPDQWRQRRQRTHHPGQEGRQRLDESCATSAPLPDDIKRDHRRARLARPGHGPNEGHKLRILLAPAPGSERLQPARVIIANEARSKPSIALSDLGRYVSVDVAAHEHRSVADRRRRRGRRHGRAALPEHLRDRAAQPDSARR